MFQEMLLFFQLRFFWKGVPDVSALFSFSTEPYVFIELQSSLLLWPRVQKGLVELCVFLGLDESAFKHGFQFENQNFVKPGLFSDDKAVTLWDAACCVRWFRVWASHVQRSENRKQRLKFKSSTLNWNKRENRNYWFCRIPCSIHCRQGWNKQTRTSST